MIYLTPQELTLDAAPAGELPRRTLAGVAVKYNVDATVSDGQKVRFAPGSLPIEGKKPKMYLYHDSSKPVGVVESRVEVGDSVLFEARISETSLGNEALTLAADGVLDAVSVGVMPTRFSYDGDVMVIEAAEWQELSLVPFGAVPGAIVEKVAATIHQEPTEIRNTEPEAPSEEITEMEQNTTEQPAVIEAQPISTTVYAQPRTFKLPTPSEYMAAYFRGGSDFAQFNANIKAAAPDITTADTPGILPTPIISTVYDGLNAIRPFVSAIGSKAMPEAGATFRRPVITVRPVVTQQPTGQLNALDPSTVTVANNNINKLTFGTYVTLSEQDIDWTDPASLNIVLEQLAIAYGQATDNYAVDTMVAGTTQFETLNNIEAKDLMECVYGAAYQISNASNYLPTHYFVSPLVWAKIGMMVDGEDRPVFPFVGQPNLLGTNTLGTQSAASWNGNPLGLTLVVDKNMAGGTGSGGLFGVVGHAAGPAAGFEFYEQQKGAISVDVPSTLGRTIAFRGYAAAFMADATKFCKITVA
jgi:HK97 family phage prohead protease